MENDEYYIAALKRAESITKAAGLFSGVVVAEVFSKIAAPENSLEAEKMRKQIKEKFNQKKEASLS